LSAEYGQIDILVNNANIDFPIKPFIELTWDQYRGERSPVKCKPSTIARRRCCRHMASQKVGKTDLSSAAPCRGDPGYGFSAHSAAKAAMDGIARVMAAELGPAGITVNTVGPGLVETDATAGLPPEVKKQTADLTPLRRIGRPDDVAGVVVILASPHGGLL
jgi:3-oxoacyl-[acyl-carrier protein] reductase